MKKISSLKKLKKSLLLFTLIYSSSIYSQEITTWVESNTNASLQLSTDGYFQYSGNDGQFQGVYGIQGNTMSLQDVNGNILQYTIQSYSESEMVLMDQFGAIYNFISTVISAHPLPWEQDKFNKVIETNKDDQWLESYTQIYVNFVQLLIGQPLSITEINDIRTSNLVDFKNNPQSTYTDVSQTEAALKQLYSLNNAEAIALFREELFASLIESAEQNPAINETILMKIYSTHVSILHYDPQTRLSLSNQDVEAYINYLQFQNMLMGQAVTLTNKEGQMIQMQLVNGFGKMNLQQQQSVAFANYIWSSVEQQWSNLNPEEQNQYIAQIQEQMNIENMNVSSQEVSTSMNQNYSYGDDIPSVADQYRLEAAQKGMTIDDYIALRKREMQADSNMFTIMQNNMMEDNAMMLNIINNMGDGDTYYTVEY